MKNEVNLLNSDIRIPTLGSCSLPSSIHPSVHARRWTRKTGRISVINSCHTCSCPFGRMDEWMDRYAKAGTLGDGGSVYKNSTAVDRILVPPCRNSGVLILISQSITKRVSDLRERSTFSSCISLRYISGVAYVQLRGFFNSKPICSINVEISSSFTGCPSIYGCSAMILNSPCWSRPKPSTMSLVSVKLGIM